ncbi:hypothetical protein AX15_006451 [Amanita polypyramis BW_CC]|nr:hypothetical protein AX15_006451 [Amanita polypyramis BW_CC]
MTHPRMIRLALAVVAFLFLFWLFAILFSPDFEIEQWHPHGRRPSHHTHPHGPDGPTISSERAQSVREAFLHAYNGYRTHAFPYDELLPVSGSKVNNFNGWGLTLFDSLDTIWLMGFHELFKHVVGFVAQSTFELKQNAFVPFFETVIRYLGSAYALSSEPILLMRADDLGRMLLPAFDTASGLPMFALNTVSGQTRWGWNRDALWSEIISNQMECKLLAHYTGRPVYYNKTETVMRYMYDANITGGLFPTMWMTANP